MSRWQQIIDNCLNEIEAAMEMEPVKDRMSRYGQAVSEAEDSAANRSFPTDLDVRNIAMAWVLTLPAAMLISAVLYWIFSQIM